MGIARQPGSYRLRHRGGVSALVALLACAAWSCPLLAQEAPSSCQNDLECQAATGQHDVTRETVSVPDVIGWAELLAQIRLASKHLVPQRAGSEPSNLARGTVLRTSPEAGTSVPRETSIAYWTASGENIVPDLGGLSTDRARASLRSSGFDLGTVAEQPRDGPPRIVLAQDPAPGFLATVGSPVAVTVSSDEVVVPEVAGQHESQVITLLRQTPLQPTRDGEQASPQPRGIVLDVQPPAGTKAKRNASVAYTIASGRNIVPDLRGHSREEAGKLLAAASFGSGATSERADLGPTGRVLEQSPAAGTMATLDTAVAMTLSRVLQVPKVVGASSGQAQKDLIALGLVPQAAGSEPSTQPKGQVLRSNPVAGTRVLDGTRVVYWIASGENTVPNLIDRGAEQAPASLAGAGFKAGSTQGRPDPGASGRILAQSPDAGELAALGSVVDLVVSVEFGRVPPVTGKPEAQATQLLRTAGFNPEPGETRRSPRPAGTVLETSPAAGERAAPGTSVRYWSASGENAVPDVRALSPSAARQHLQEAGFTVGPIDRAYAPGIDEQVRAQSPQAGDAAPLRSGVALTIASGVPIVPDLAGKTLDDATASLQQAGLAVGAVTREFRTGEDEIVLGQQYPPGARRAPGDEVALRVSRTFTAAVIGAGALLLGLGGGWWTLLRPWPLKPPLYLDARLEPIDAVDPASIEAVRSSGRDTDVVLSAHLEHDPADAACAPIVEQEKAHD